MLQHQLLYSILKKDEGTKLKVYKDTLGNWGIGTGRLIGKNLEDLELSKETVSQMLREDIDKAISVVNNIFGPSAREWSAARSSSVISLAFNMGEGNDQRGLRSFKKMIAAIKENRWDDAANELLDSNWAKQVDPKARPDEGRDDRLAYMLRTGKFHQYYTEGAV